MDNEKIKNFFSKEKLKELVDKIKEFLNKKEVKDFLNKTKEISIKLFYFAKEKSKIVWAKIKEKMPIVKSYCTKAYKFIKAQTIKLCLFIKAKTPVVCKFIKEKSIVVYNEIKKNPKQGIVAGVILLFAILLIVFSFSGSKDEASTVLETTKTSKVVSEVKAVKNANIVSKLKNQTQPTTAVLKFTAETEKPLVFEVFYTVKREVWFDAQHVVSYQGSAGLNEYEIELPFKEVFKVRLDFGSNPGTVVLSNMSMIGTQNADLSDTSNYDFRNIEEYEIGPNGDVVFTSHEKDPFIIYKKALLPE